MVGASVLGLALAGIWVLAPQPNAGYRDAAAVLGVVSATALGIERVLEAAWTIVGGAIKAGHWFGYGAAASRAKSMLDGMNSTAAPFFERVAEILTTVKEDQWKGRLDLAIQDVGDQGKKLEEQLKELQQLTTSKEKADALVTTARQAIQVVNTKYGRLSTDIRVAAAAAEQSVVAVKDLVDTFKDNPAKRLISLYASMILGLGVAAITGADLFSASLAQPDVAVSGSVAGVILTGLVMGLGSAPTHEVIKILQGFKRAQSAEPPVAAWATPQRFIDLPIGTVAPAEAPARSG
jgi:hypothetical protein